MLPTGVWQMPLSAELRDASSPIALWMNARFPHTAALQPAWTAALTGARTLRPHHDGRIDWAGIGTAFGYRLGYALASYPPYHALRAVPALGGDDAARHRAAAMFEAHRDLPSEFCADLRPLPDGRCLVLPRAARAGRQPGEPSAWDSLVDFFTRVAQAVDRYPLGTRCPLNVERSLAKAWYALGLLEGVYRRGLDQAACAWLPVTQRDLTSDYLADVAPEYVIADLGQLADALTGKGLRQFPARPTIVSPELVECWPDADLLVGDLLVDCKTTVKPRELHAEWAYQLLGYALLDGGDFYGIRQVGIYLARQARLVKWALDEFTATLSGGPAPHLGQLRAEFGEIVAATLGREDPCGWRSRWVTGLQPAADASSPARSTGGRTPDRTRTRFVDRAQDARLTKPRGRWRGGRWRRSTPPPSTGS